MNQNFDQLFGLEFQIILHMNKFQVHIINIFLYFSIKKNEINKSKINNIL